MRVPRDRVYRLELLFKHTVKHSQFIADAAKSGVTHETLQNGAGRVMTEHEARQILGKYDHLFEKKAKVGNFYLQSKAHRAKECSEASHRAKGEGSPTS
ncbi:ENTH/VHS family protein, putative isoform 1 [Hibiscus syriacus]|uniref:ENTH/VHS family protein, putative isoform 1 n=1 Tax=Hibiscus syriacus TaxID=106335 RepID=A0A6A2YDL3_HIBSY|nr:ENTH/VHS family protein, putative isoform 1 [Hibiscus syriacus]